jgi:hypothetical protein
MPIILTEEEDIRRFEEYLRNPSCTVRGLKMCLTARLMVPEREFDGYISHDEARRRLAILETLDDDLVIYYSEFSNYFGE